MANTSALAKLNGIDVECFIYAEPYVPARMSGHPDSWTDAEGGDIEIERVDYETDGRAYVNGQWIKIANMVVDVLPILSDSDVESLYDQCHEYLNSVEE